MKIFLLEISEQLNNQSLKFLPTFFFIKIPWYLILVNYRSFMFPLHSFLFGSWIKKKCMHFYFRYYFIHEYVRRVQIPSISIVILSVRKVRVVKNHTETLELFWVGTEKWSKEPVVSHYFFLFLYYFSNINFWIVFDYFKSSKEESVLWKLSMGIRIQLFLKFDIFFIQNEL